MYPGTRTLALTFSLLCACNQKENDQDWDTATTGTGNADGGSDDGSAAGSTVGGAGAEDGGGETGGDGTTGGAADGTADGVDTGTADDTGEPGPAEATIWTGPTITFTKANFADPTDAANQDAISDRVILTRGGRGSLLNVVLEDAAGSTSPLGTEWAKGTTADIGSLTFEHLKGAADNQMSRLPDTDYVLHLIEENIYIDVKFLSWTSGGSSGGGFSYQRSTAGGDSATTESSDDASGTWEGSYPGTIRLDGVSTVCEGALSIAVHSDGSFGGTGVCGDATLGDFASYTADFTGSFSEDGTATGEVSIDSFVVSSRYDLTGSIGEDGITLAWVVDDISINGSFESL